MLKHLILFERAFDEDSLPLINSMIVPPLDVSLTRKFKSGGSWGYGGHGMAKGNLQMAVEFGDRRSVFVWAFWLQQLVNSKPGLISAVLTVPQFWMGPMSCASSFGTKTSTLKHGKHYRRKLHQGIIELAHAKQRHRLILGFTMLYHHPLLICFENPRKTTPFQGIYKNMI